MSAMTRIVPVEVCDGGEEADEEDSILERLSEATGDEIFYELEIILDVIKGC